jgi:hypothetical protein
MSPRTFLDVAARRIPTHAGNRIPVGQPVAITIPIERSEDYKYMKVRDLDLSI